MHFPLLWLNVVLVIALALALSQRELLDEGIERRADLIFITDSDAPTGRREVAAAVRSFEGTFDREVTVLVPGDTAESLARTLRGALSLEPKGISMPGHLDSELLLPFVTEARRSGVAITFHTVPFPEAERRFAKQGTGFIGAGGQLNGEYATRSSLQRAKFAVGDVVLVAGGEATPAPGSLLFGCIKAIGEAGGAAEYFQVTPPDADPLSGLRPLLQRIAALPSPIVYWDAGDISRLTDVLDSEGFALDDLHLVTFSPVAMATSAALGEGQLYIKQRYYEPTYTSCYFSLVQLCLAEQYGVAGMHISVNANL